jgi:hypothetical protein
VQVFGLVPVEFQGLLPAILLDANELIVDPLGPIAEVVNLAADLLLPFAGRVRSEGEVWLWLLRPSCRFTELALSSRLKHALPPSSAGSGGVAAGGLQPPGAI